MSAVPHGTCLIHGSFAGGSCPACSTAVFTPHGFTYEPLPPTPALPPSVDYWLSEASAAAAARDWRRLTLIAELIAGYARLSAIDDERHAVERSR